MVHDAVCRGWMLRAIGSVPAGCGTEPRVMVGAGAGGDVRHHGHRPAR